MMDDHTTDPLHSSELSSEPGEIETNVLAAAYLGRETMHGRIFRAAEEPDHVYYLQTPDGVQRVEASPKSRGEALLSPTALAEFAHDFKGERSALFLGKERIVFVYDVSNRRDRATVALAYSEPFKALQQAMRGVGHKEFVRLLKIGLRDAIQDAKLRSAVETVKFDSDETGESTIGHTHQGVSVSVQKQLRGVTEIPEEVAVKLSIYEDVDYAVQITCAVEVDPFKKTFALTPLPAQMQTAFDLTFEVIENQLEGAGVKVYRGQP